MEKPLIIANWKMNPTSAKEATELMMKVEGALARMRRVEVVIAPPFLFLSHLSRMRKRCKLGAQNTFWGDTGPYTGEISWRQLKKTGVSHIIVGHSERRLFLGETDEMINKKIRTLLSQNFFAVLCIGERERSGHDIPAVVGEQLKNALIGVPRGHIKNLVVAYEPVWAISTASFARPDTPDNAFRVAVYIRKVLSGLYGRGSAEHVRVIYGGSVRAKNITPFLLDGKMEGALVGHASLDPQEFMDIVRRATQAMRH